MPTVLRSGPYRFYFYSHEPNEPPHIHVDRDNLSAKFSNSGLILSNWQATLDFAPTNCARYNLLITEYRAQFLESWKEFFGIGG